MRPSSHQHPFFTFVTVALPFWMLWLLISLPLFATKAWGFSIRGSTSPARASSYRHYALPGRSHPVVDDAPSFPNSVQLEEGSTTRQSSFFQPHHQKQLEHLKIRFETDHSEHPLANRLFKMLDRWQADWPDQPTLLRLLEKTNLYDELEESIMALGYFIDWLNHHDSQEEEQYPMALIDVCCGKGIMSLVASYLFEDDPRIAVICMLDKDTSVDWSHVDVINRLLLKKRNNERPFLVTLPETNLLENPDALLSTLVDAVATATTQTDTSQRTITPKKGQSDNANSLLIPPTTQIPMAMIGVHLCKNLSPALVGIVNRFGPSQVPFACVAPCCLPRQVLQGKRTHPRSRMEHGTNERQTKKRKPSFLPVLQYESPSHQQDRMMAITKRALAKRRRPVPCIICHSSAHSMRQCPQLVETYPDAEERQTMLEQAAAREPCWKCGEVGHVKKDCPSKQTSSVPALISPPHMDLDFSQVLLASDPFDQYCRLLSSAVDRNHVTVHKARLTPKKTRHSLKSSHHKNWNRNRKSLFIVAT